MTLYVVRHGQTDYNAEHRFQGRLDIPLNETGKAQAAHNGKTLRTILGDEVTKYDFVSSPMIRTRQTMEIIRGEIGGEMTFDIDDYRREPQLVELSFGDWEGHTLDELQRDRPDEYNAREASKWSYVPPGEGAESYELLSHRVAEFLKTVNGPTICVAHGGILRSLFFLTGNMTGEEAATGLIPQDKVLKINDNHIEWIS